MVGLSYYDRGRGCFCKRATLAAMLNVSLYQLRKAIQELLDAQLIVIHRRGYGKTSIIRVVANTPTLQVQNTSPHTTTIEEEETEEEFVDTQPEGTTANNTDSPETPQDGFGGGLKGHTAPNTIQPDSQHQEGTEGLLRALKELIRPQSFRHWFEDKVAISYEDEQSLTIQCLNSYIADWLNEHYSHLVEGIVKKSVAFHGRETYDAKDNKDRYRKLEC